MNENEIKVFNKKIETKNCKEIEVIKNLKNELSSNSEAILDNIHFLETIKTENSYKELGYKTFSEFCLCELKIYPDIINNYLGMIEWFDFLLLKEISPLKLFPVYTQLLKKPELDVDKKKEISKHFSEKVKLLTTKQIYDAVFEMKQKLGLYKEGTSWREEYNKLLVKYKELEKNYKELKGETNE
jgi:hypothetical protein